MMRLNCDLEGLEGFLSPLRTPITSDSGDITFQGSLRAPEPVAAFKRQYSLRPLTSVEQQSPFKVALDLLKKS